MIQKNILLNLLGQIRIYSLIDLIILLIAIDTPKLKFIGVILLHLGFLLFLEYTHKHKYRVKFPKYLWILFILIGIVLYNSPLVLGFLVFSFLYAKKNLPILCPYSPIFRGIQSYFLVAGVIGLFNPFSFLVGILLLLRNFAGDLRDITKDQKEGMNTLPVILGFSNNVKYIHLIFILFTTFIWWYLADISIIWILIAYMLQIGSYNLTPR